MTTRFNFRNILWMLAGSLLVGSTLSLNACKDDEEEFLGNWKAKSDFSGRSRYGAASFVINDQAYIVSGYNAHEKEYLKDCWRFDIDKNQWEEMDMFPGEGRVYSIGFEAGGKGYVACGYRSDSMKYYADVWVFDPSAERGSQWTQSTTKYFANDSTKALYGATAFTINGKGYVIGGYRKGQGTLNETWEFDPASDTWTKKADITKKRYFAQSFVLNGKGYVLGGNNNNSCPTDLYAYDPASNTWEQKRAINNASDDDYDDDYQNIARQQASTFVIGTLAYITLGSVSSSTLNTTWEYDAIADVWTRKTDFEGAARVNAIGFTIKGRGFVTTGGTQSSAYDDTWEFLPLETKVSGD